MPSMQGEITESASSAPSLAIKPLASVADATSFRKLNEEWITHFFVLEQKDIDTLNDPEATILRIGGQVLMARLDGEPVGCIALIPAGSGVLELSKMAVSPKFRGRGIGRKLVERAIAEARNLGARSLFLGSNTKLVNAVHLYESFGFVHVPLHEIPPMPYTRANVFMRLAL